MRRRTLMLLAAALASALGGRGPASGETGAPSGLPGPEEAVRRLAEGNQRYVEGELLHPHRDLRKRLALSHGQQPFAVLVGCSDSRVPPAVVFDQGLGDLFVIRTAGHVLDRAVLGSIEYAVEHLRTPLVVVMGHDRCGAVTASIRGASEPGHLRRIVEAIRPAVLEVRHDRRPIQSAPKEIAPRHLQGTLAHANFLSRCIVANVEGTIEQMLEASRIVREAAEAGRTRVLGAFYDLDSGKVDLRW